MPFKTSHLGIMKALLNRTANRRFGILCVGDPSVDDVFSVPVIPAPAEKIVATRARRYPGGTTANVACAASRLGQTAAAIGRVGSDADGEFLLSAFKEAGVNVDYMATVAGEVSSRAMIMVEPSGEKALVYSPLQGAPTTHAQLAEALSQSRVVYATPYDRVRFQQLAELAHVRSVVVAIDLEMQAAPTQTELGMWMRVADVVFLNEVTFRHAMGCEPNPETLVLLAQWGAAVIIVTLGSRGAIAVSGSELVQHDAFATNVVDATGAGDGFAAAYLAAVLDGACNEHALRFANAAAHFAVMTEGARSGYPNRQGVEAFLKNDSANSLNSQTQFK
jgi:sugar/nucleoside kinase (ribokinase family)